VSTAAAARARPADGKYVAGLEGVVAAQTRLSHVDGEAGELIIAGYPVEALAGQATFEEAVYLLWNDDLPNREQLESFKSALARQRALPAIALDVLRAAAAQALPGMDALRMATGTLSLADGAEATDMRAAGAALLARVPVVDHGLNASTFTARVIISTGSDLVSAVVGAIGALKGPLHGGAPGPALDMVFEIREASRAESYLRARLDRHERLMGFGHRVYRVRDPRADVLAAAAERLYRRAGDMALYELAKSVEATALRLLAEYQPGRRLQTNVEYYTALLLHGLGLPPELFTPTFAVSRAAGWIAHSLEQARESRIIRPQSEYIGPRGRQWVPLEER
jgi:citrate synthase